MILIVNLKTKMLAALHTHSLRSKVQVKSVLNIPTVQKKCQGFTIPP